MRSRSRRGWREEPASLELREIAKHYGGLRAVDGVSTVAEPGEVLGIAGPNGAGKTTLFDVVSGLTPATAGDVLLGGETIAALSVHRRCHRGMARTFQQPTVAGSLTTYENLLVAAKYGRAGEHWAASATTPRTTRSGRSTGRAWRRRPTSQPSCSASSTRSG